MKASFTESERIRKEIKAQFVKEVENNGYTMASAIFTSAIKDVVEHNSPVNRVSVILYSEYDYQEDEVFFLYGVEYYDCSLPYSEREKVTGKRFETAKEAMDFIESRANAINKFFESLD